MGRNGAIKRFDSTPPGQSMDLLSAPQGRAPIVLELLNSPWIRRGSDLESGEGAGKRAEVPVEVSWDAGRARPVAFVREGRRHAVDVVIQQWAVDRCWWDRAGAVSRRCFRVLARGGVFDLAYDRLREEWLLIGVVD